MEEECDLKTGRGNLEVFVKGLEEGASQSHRLRFRTGEGSKEGIKEGNAETEHANSRADACPPVPQYPNANRDIIG